MTQWSQSGGPWLDSRFGHLQDLLDSVHSRVHSPPVHTCPIYTNGYDSSNRWSIGTNGRIGTNRKGCHSNGSVGEYASH